MESLKFLKDAGVYEDTLAWYAGENGPKEGIQVPVTISRPGVQKEAWIMPGGGPPPGSKPTGQSLGPGCS